MEITILNEGNQPLIGNAGIKKMAIVDNETDFELLWFDYTSDNIPTIDFQTDIVVLYDMGGERNLDSSCGNKVSLTNLTAEKIDISVSQINVNLSKDCPLPPDSPCLPVVLPGRPYIIASAPRNSEVLISENMTFFTVQLSYNKKYIKGFQMISAIFASISALVICWLSLNVS